MSRLDYVLVPAYTLLIITHCQILPAFLSDHCPIVWYIELYESLCGPGYWKLNTKHLNDKEYIDQINIIIDKAQLYVTENNCYDKWDICKEQIKQFSIKYAAQVGRKRRAELDNLNKKLNAMYKKLACINLRSVTAVSWIQKINKKIDEINCEINKNSRYAAEGAILRAKAKWSIEGEQCSKYFLNLEKRNAKNKVMNVISDNGKLIHENYEILNHQAKFFQQLYSNNENVTPDLGHLHGPKISHEQKQNLETDITLQELQEVVKSMKHGKSPGMDGLPVEFYIVFWSRVKDLLFMVYKKAINSGCLHYSARQGMITLIPKKERDVLFIKNWRPITLLNVDYKVLSKVFASRIKTVLDDIIHRDQTGFLKGRCISENLHIILDTLDYCDINKIPAVFISIDFEKAFDRVGYSALAESLRLFGFGENFVGFVALLFNEITLFTTNNGYISPPLKTK